MTVMLTLAGATAAKSVAVAVIAIPSISVGRLPPVKVTDAAPSLSVIAETGDNEPPRRSGLLNSTTASLTGLPNASTTIADTVLELPVETLAGVALTVTESGTVATKVTSNCEVGSESRESE